jgi:succinate dehydrogenase hydrophobic anchor subunit
VAELRRGRRETADERADRNLAELVSELRLALPGVQVLFAFLLAVPFADGFTRITEFQKLIYFATLVCTAISAALLIAPSVHHRIAFRQRDKEYLVEVSNRFAIAGLTVLALAMTLALLLITDYLFSPAAAATVAALAALTFASLWYAAPLRRRLARSRAGKDL